LPEATYRPFRQPAGLGGVRLRIPGKILALDDTGQPGVLTADFFQGLINGQNLVVMFDHDPVSLPQGLPSGSTPAFDSQFFPGMINQNLSHCLCGKAQEMTAVDHVGTCPTRDLDIGFMDQVRRFETLAPMFVKLPPRQPMQLLVQQTVNPTCGVFISSRSSMEEHRNVVTRFQTHENILTGIQ